MSKIEHFVGTHHLFGVHQRLHHDPFAQKYFQKHWIWSVRCAFHQNWQVEDSNPEISLKMCNTTYNHLSQTLQIVRALYIRYNLHWIWSDHLKQEPIRWILQQACAKNSSKIKILCIYCEKFRINYFRCTRAMKGLNGIGWCGVGHDTKIKVVEWIGK